MNQTLASLRRSAAELKEQRKVGAYKKHVAELNEAIRRQREKTSAEEARAEMAEHQVRQIAAERDLWKHQAQEAQAALKSLGREP